MSALKFYPLSISDIRRETSECVSIAFTIPSSLANTFVFLQGQYITLRTMIEGQEIRRSYSICSAPKDGELRVAIKKVEGGVFSTFANEQLSIGEIIDVMPPMGKFYSQLDDSLSRNYVGFASGSGITPVFSILKTILQTEPTSTFTLFYGNKNTSCVIFKEAIEALKNKYIERLKIYYILSREAMDTPLFSGRLDGEKARAFAKYFFAPEAIDAYYLCGPEEMIFDIKDTLIASDVQSSKIHFELFTSTTAKQKQVKKVINTSFSEKNTIVSLRLDGKTMEFAMPQEGIYLLDVALENGADLPYACKGGVCCTCKAKLIEGQVVMDVNYGLEADEIAANYILTCQARPTTDKIIVDFDA